MPPTARAALEAQERAEVARLLAFAAALRARLWKDIAIGAAVFGVPQTLCCGAVMGWRGLLLGAFAFGWGGVAGAALNRAGGGAIRGTASYGACALGDFITQCLVLGDPLAYGHAAVGILVTFVLRFAVGLGAGRWLGMMRTFERMDGVA